MDGTITAPVSPWLLQSAVPLAWGAVQTGSRWNSGRIWVLGQGLQGKLPALTGSRAGAQELMEFALVGICCLLGEYHLGLPSTGEGYWPWPSPELG